MIVEPRDNIWMAVMYIALGILIGLWAGDAKASLNSKHSNEKGYQKEFCINGLMEKTLVDRSRVDCETIGLAVEIDYARNFKYAIGQALHYSAVLNKFPGVVLIMETKKDCAYLDRLYKLLAFHRIKSMIFEIGPYAYRCAPLTQEIM